MQRSNDTADAVALFLLAGNKVHRIAAGERRVTDKQFYRAARDSNNEKVER